MTEEQYEQLLIEIRALDAKLDEVLRVLGKSYFTVADCEWVRPSRTVELEYDPYGGEDSAAPPRGESVGPGGVW